MNINIKTISTGIILILVLAGGAYLIYRDISNNRVDEAGYTIEKLSPEEISVGGDSDTGQSVNIPVPDLNRMVINNKDLPPEAVAVVEKNIRALSEELNKNSDQLDLWLDLGIQRKIAGDYEGARDAWVYATLIRPTGSVAFHNLGDLYAYYLHDNTKAEQNFLKAIENSPNDVYLYFKATEFYRDVLKDISSARAIVERGITANPSSTELQSLLKFL